MKARQFVHVVMQKYGRNSSFYTVSRIKAEEQLFYPSTAEAQAPQKKKLNMALPSSPVVPPSPWMEIMPRMPPAMLRFERSSSDKLDFLPFYERGNGSDDASKILCLDSSGHSILHDIDAGSSQPVPSLNGPKGENPICFSITSPNADDPEQADALYVMKQFPVSRNPCNFEVLKYSDPDNGGKLEGWHWHRLPPPMAHVDVSLVECHALLDIDGDPIFLVSSHDQSRIGTHCFNTVSRKWFKAGRWTLPFFSRAEHVPELDNLWFGIGNCRPNNFYAMDLSSIHPDKAPELLYEGQDLDLREDWVLLDCGFVYLGAGRFCITKIFEFGEDEDTSHPTEMGAVISGVEVVHGKNELHLLKHKSKFYNFVRDDIVCVL